ncbi:DUF4352 domain-containing protein [Micromonosporaceae bacterium Da 78-11]
MTYVPHRPTVRPAAQLSQTTLRVTWSRIAGGILTLAALGAGGCSSAGGDSTEGDKAAPSAAASTAVRTAAEGAFAFTVTGTKCGVQSVGPADLSQKAVGQFCLVDVSVKNLGKEADLLDGSAQRVVDAQGKEYAVADNAAVFLNDQSPSLLEEIKPGAEVRGTLPFEVPAGAEPAAIVLHESGRTPGVRVPLS